MMTEIKIFGRQGRNFIKHIVICEDKKIELINELYSAHCGVIII